MIKIIYGEKGTGKTKRIIDMANEIADKAKGSIVFLDDDKRYMYDLKSSIRFIDSREHLISGPKLFTGFISGMAAQDFDLEYIFVDGFLRMIKHPLDTLKEMFDVLERFTAERGITIVMSISGSDCDFPDFAKKYLIEV
ncbi:MAG TPA: ATP-binding protein [Clostridiales bacterium]|jgi:thymidine kinase|nr:ATP-binding protein [Clostridiales bacterium]